MGLTSQPMLVTLMPIQLAKENNLPIFVIGLGY
jgi:hypothetical protein